MLQHNELYLKIKIHNIRFLLHHVVSYNIMTIDGYIDRFINISEITYSIGLRKSYPIDF